MNLLITGATGFIGKRVLDELSKQVGNDIQCLVRSNSNKALSGVKNIFVKDLCDESSLVNSLVGKELVIHVAAIAHKASLVLSKDIDNINSINTEYPLALARAAIKQGVKRFVFISSIGVNGSCTSSPFSEADIPEPHNAYAMSKYKAELGLLELSRQTAMDVVIIRPPLVYGPNPPGNFFTLLKLIKKPYPLPLANVTHNKRSLIAVENLVDFILLCADYKKTPQAANQTFVISDGEDVSTAELLRRVANAYGQKSCLFPFPLALLRLGAKVLGKQEMVDRLLGSLQIDNSKAKSLLGWKPVVTMEEQLRKMAVADADIS